MVYVDPDTMLPIDYEVYAFDLDHANKYDEPKWDLLYDYRKIMGLEDLSPQSIYDYAHQVLRNEEVAKEYRNHKYVGGPGDDPEAPCDTFCREMLFCEITSNDFDESRYCLDQDKF